MTTAALIAAVLALSPEAQTVGICLAVLGAVLTLVKLLNDQQTAEIKLHLDNALLRHEAGCTARQTFAAVPEPCELSQSGRIVVKAPEEPKP